MVIDSDTIYTTNPILQVSAASLIQRIFRGYISRSQQPTQPTIPIVTTISTTSMTTTTTTDYEFPGGFKVAIDVAKPITNTDGNNAGRLYKKENRPSEGSKEEKELLSDIKVNRYPKYKVLNLSLIHI